LATIDADVIAADGRNLATNGGRRREGRKTSRAGDRARV
jgi:hypothetical protein